MAIDANAPLNRAYCNRTGPDEKALKNSIDFPPKRK